MLIAFNKPYGVLSQFTQPREGSTAHRTLSEFGFPREVYPIGRLDAESEGLLLLSDEPELNFKLLDPKHGHARTYWVQVEKVPASHDLQKLQKGVALSGEKTRACRAWMLDPQPLIAARMPPIRVRSNIPDCWIGLELTEGKNRQVRRMTAAIGFPTLRLIRVKIGAFDIGALPPGQWRRLGEHERKSVFQK